MNQRLRPQAEALAAAAEALLSAVETQQYGNQAVCQQYQHLDHLARRTYGYVNRLGKACITWDEEMERRGM